MPKGSAGLRLNPGEVRSGGKFMDDASSPIGTEYTEEERNLILNFDKLSPYDQAEILAWAERELEGHAKDAAKANHLHLVKSPAFPPKKR